MLVLSLDTGWVALAFLPVSHHIEILNLPQANGMLERMHRQLTAALQARFTEASCMDELPIVLHGEKTVAVL